MACEDPLAWSVADARGRLPDPCTRFADGHGRDGGGCADQGNVRFRMLAAAFAPDPLLDAPAEPDRLTYPRGAVQG
jgi:hypothetical protein